MRVIRARCYTLMALSATKQDVRMRGRMKSESVTGVDQSLNPKSATTNSARTIASNATQVKRSTLQPARVVGCTMNTKAQPETASGNAPKITLESLDVDTQRSVTAILKRGFYNRCETLGENGWPYLNERGIGDWKRYWLSAEDSDGTHFDDNISARNDKTAREAFASKYDLGDLAFYSIHELTTTYKEI